MILLNKFLRSNSQIFQLQVRKDLYKIFFKLVASSFINCYKYKPFVLGRFDDRTKPSPQISKSQMESKS